MQAVWPEEGEVGRKTVGVCGVGFGFMVAVV